MNALADPINAITHIQNTAPGPPITIAVATPARFPVPTRPAIETANASKEEIFRSFFSLDELFNCLLPFTLSVPVSSNSLNMWPIIPNCTNLVLNVNHKPHAIRVAIRT